MAAIASRSRPAGERPSATDFRVSLRATCPYRFENRNVGIIFVIPGHRDTLRVSGKGAVVQDAKLGRELAVNGRPAELLLLVRVEPVLCHCPKAFIGGRVWQPDEWPDTSDVPTLADMMKAYGEMSETLDEVEAGLSEDRETRLY